MAFSRGAVAKPAADAQPSGIVASARTLGDVLGHVERARGATNAPAVAYDWTIVDHGEAGTLHQIVSSTDFVERRADGPFTSADGKRDGQFWTQNENAITTLLGGDRNAEFSEDDTLAIESHVDSARKLLGEVKTPEPCYVVEERRNHSISWTFVDEATWLVDRVETYALGRRRATTYDTYEAFGSLVRATHARTTSGDDPDAKDERLTSVREIATFPSEEFAIPVRRTPEAVFPATTDGIVALPARLVSGYVIVRVKIGNRGLDFLLDSGSDGMAIDDGVAGELGLTLHGTPSVKRKGVSAVTKVLVPKLEIGGVTMRNVAMHAFPFRSDADMNTTVVGLIGFDFFANAVVRIDYANAKVYAIDPRKYAGPKDDEIRIPIELDERIPVAQARVGHAVGHFYVDTGASDLLLFSGFAAAHAADVTDQGRGLALRSAIPFYADSVVGLVELEPVELKTFAFANVLANEFVAMIPKNEAYFDTQPQDGLIGFNILRLYEVTFDYHEGIVTLVQSKALLKERDRKPDVVPSVEPIPMITPP